MINRITNACVDNGSACAVSNAVAAAAADNEDEDKEDEDKEDEDKEDDDDGIADADFDRADELMCRPPSLRCTSTKHACGSRTDNSF